MSQVTGIDHIYLSVSDMAVSEGFYDCVLGEVIEHRKNRFVLAGDPHVQYYNRHFGIVLRPARMACSTSLTRRGCITCACGWTRRWTCMKSRSGSKPWACRQRRPAAPRVRTRLRRHLFHRPRRPAVGGAQLPPRAARPA